MSSETNTVWEEVHDPGGCMRVGITNGRKWSPPTTHELPADVLHPLATIQWETCWKLEDIYYDCIDTVVLGDKLYLEVTCNGNNGLLTWQLGRCYHCLLLYISDFPPITPSWCWLEVG